MRILLAEGTWLFNGGASASHGRTAGEVIDFVAEAGPRLKTVAFLSLDECPRFGPFFDAGEVTPETPLFEAFFCVTPP